MDPNFDFIFLSRKTKGTRRQQNKARKKSSQSTNDYKHNIPSEQRENHHIASTLISRFATSTNSLDKTHLVKSAKCLLKMISLIALRLSFHCPLVSGPPLPLAAASAAAATTPAIGVGGIGESDGDCCEVELEVDIDVEAAAAVAAAAVAGLKGLLGSRSRDSTATSGIITCPDSGGIG